MDFEDGITDEMIRKVTEDAEKYIAITKAN